MGTPACWVCRDDSLQRLPDEGVALCLSPYKHPSIYVMYERDIKHMVLVVLEGCNWARRMVIYGVACGANGSRSGLKGPGHDISDTGRSEVINIQWSAVCFPSRPRLSIVD